MVAAKLRKGISTSSINRKPRLYTAKLLGPSIKLIMAVSEYLNRLLPNEVPTLYLPKANNAFTVLVDFLKMVSTLAQPK